MRLSILYSLLLVSAAAGADWPLVDQPDKFPNRVHVFEDFETEIEKRWWHRGVEEKWKVEVDPARQSMTRHCPRK